MDCSLPGTSDHEIFQARILECIAISYSRQSSWPRDPICVSWIFCIVKQILYHCAPWVCMCICVHTHTRTCLTVTPWTVARQAPLSMEFSRQGYWSGFLFASPGDLPDPGIKPMALASPALAGKFFTTRNATWETLIYNLLIISL